jgi:hypothetical protein
MEISGSQIQQLHEALLSAFPQESSLAQMVRFHLNVNLRSITDSSSMRETVFRLIEWAESRGLITELVNAALEANPNNSKLNAVSEMLQASVEPAVEVPDAIKIGDIPELPEALIQACAEGDCVLYAGSGLSASTGLPTWRPFLEQLLTWALNAKIITPERYSDLWEALLRNQTDSVADSVVRMASAHSSEALFAFVREIFQPEGLQPTDTHRILPTIPLAAALTTNFDSLLEQTFFPNGNSPEVYTPQDAEALLGAHSRHDFFILKLYGVLERPEGLLLSPAGYRQSVVENVPFSRFMDGLFASRTLLFIGNSLSGIEDYLSGISFAGASSSVPRTHFALVNVPGTGWQTQADNLENRFGIKVLPYRTLGDFSEVAGFLQNLATAVAARRATQLVDSPATSWLSQVLLTNIGPFPNLTLDLNQGFNLLLGDNGVGKSSILRAIAVGLSGEDADPDYAGHLIRSGSKSASIQLVTSTGKKYETTLHETDGRYRVGTVTARALEAENWLAVGFPALRLITWRRFTETLTEEVQRPTAADLTPLIRSTTDSRLDRVKQWIVDRETRLRLATDPVEQDRYRRLLQDFYTVLERLTPGLDLHFTGVDLQTKSVQVTIQGVPVALEAISQGTASLIGWIGVLLQRIYDLYGDAPQPRESYALLLIDEIDAHMHPAWQKMIVSAIGEFFPHVQVIATTHSPLVVGGMENREVIVLNREPGSPTVSVRKIKGDLMTMRADQILTSSLFGLPSTRHSDRLVNRYSELLGRTQRTAKEQSEFEELRSRLREGLKSEETPFQQAVEEAIRTTLDQPQKQDSGASAPDMSPVHAIEIQRQIQKLLDVARGEPTSKTQEPENEVNA